MDKTMRGTCKVKIGSKFQPKTFRRYTPEEIQMQSALLPRLGEIRPAPIPKRSDRIRRRWRDRLVGAAVGVILALAFAAALASHMAHAAGL